MVVLLFLGTGLFLISQNEQRMANDFVAGMQAQNLAEAGVQDGLCFLKNDSDLLYRAQNGLLDNDSILKSAAETFDEGNYEVYMTSADDQLLVMSIGHVGKIKAQIVVYLQFKNDEFEIVRYE
jgi:Tfp pilus assembly protein PilX